MSAHLVKKQVVQLKNRVTALKEELGIFHKELSDNSNKIIYSSQEYREQLSTCRMLVRAALELTFGAENDSNKRGAVGDYIKYEIHAGNPYQDAVLFAYLAPDGGDTFKLEIGHKPSWRENFFYKGTRWSKLSLKKQFYHFFNMLKSVVGSNHVPLNYWVEHTKSQYFQVISSEGQASLEGVLYLPSYGDVKTSEYSHQDFCPDSSTDCAYRKLIEVIQELRNENTKDTTIFNAAKTSIEQLKQLFDKAWEHVGKDDHHQQRLQEWVANFRKSGLDVEKDGEGERSVFDVMCLYQYHDIPFAIDIFLPHVKKKELKVTTWLVFTHDIRMPIPKEEVDIFLELSQLLSRLPLIEKKLAEYYKRDIELSWKWEREYRKISPLYERLADIVKIMIQAFCDKEGIKVHLIQGRVKDYSSLFNKLVARANGRDKEHKRKAHLYFKWIQDGDVINALKHVLDVAGVRVICIFNEDIKKVHEVIKQARDKKQLHIVRGSVRDYTKAEKVKGRRGVGYVYGYRSKHLTIQLDGPRLTLPESEGLAKRNCEIQLRSILAHGWADIAHSVRYKSNLPSIAFDTEQGKTIEKVMFAAAQKLADEDERFEAVRTAYEQLIMLYADK